MTDKNTFDALVRDKLARALAGDPDAAGWLVKLGPDAVEAATAPDVATLTPATAYVASLKALGTPALKAINVLLDSATPASYGDMRQALITLRNAFLEQLSVATGNQHGDENAS